MSETTPHIPRQTAWDRASQQRSQSTRRRRDQPPGRQSTPRLKPHFPHLIRYVYMSRYVTIDQVRVRFADTYQNDRTGRTSRRHLKQLVDLGYLNTTDPKFSAPTDPLVYVCSGKGTNYLRQHFGHQLVEARDESRSTPLIEHDLLLTQFELACWQTVQARRDLTLLFTERRYFHATKQLRESPPKQAHAATNQVKKRERRHLAPDAGFLLSLDRGPERPPGRLLYFVEMDNGTESPDVVLAKFQKYDRWASSAYGQQALLNVYRQFDVAHPKPNFRLLVIARYRGTTTGQDVRRLADLFVQALELTDAMRHRIYFTTADFLRAHQHENPPLAAPLWIRAADATDWIPDYRNFVTNLDKSKGDKPTLAKREYATQRFTYMPVHTMFPQPVTVSHKP